MRLSSLFAALIIFATGSLQASVLLTLEPQSPISVGTTSEVQLRLSGLGQHTSPSVGAFDLNLAFNPSVLSFSGLTFGDPVLGDQLNLAGASTISDATSQGAGLLELFEVSLASTSVLNAQQPDTFVLATLRFQGVANGTSLLTPTLNAVSDASGNALVVGVQTGRIDVTAAPEPGSLWLMTLPAALTFWLVRQSKLHVR